MEKTNKKIFYSQVIKGAITSVSIALLCILLFAVLIRFMNISDGLIKPINQVIKVASILFGVVVALKNNNEKGLLKGLIIGAIFAILAYLIFAILSGRFDFDITLLIDLMFSSVIGAIAGIIVVNIKK